jgi:chromosome segregation protein
MSQRVYEGVENRLTDLSEQLQEVEADHEFKASRLDSIQRELSETSEEIAQGEESRSALENQITEAREKIEPEEKALRESEEIRTSLETEEMQNRAGLQNAEREHSRAQIHLARRQEELVSLQRRIEDDFGLVTFDFENGVMGQDPLPFEGLVEHLPRVEEVAEETESQVNRLRNQLRRLGAVNPSAKIEYDEVRNRVDFLTTQTEDSHKAEEQIQNVIAELDLLMEREFRKTFDAVAIEFQHAFTHLFGGGSARLGLTNSEDLTQTGIDIEARLPGRREQGLAMLSGGERSLTASALIFALMKVSPTPFCVLDEVDAMLDDVNVVRFREMLQDLSKNTQFVVITHNRMTVQVAEVVYGVTMGSDSASQIISLRLEDAEKVLAGKG